MAWYFTVASKPSEFACTKKLLISCVFSCADNLHHLGIPLTHEDDFNKNKYAHIKSAYKSIFDDYGANADEIWINGN